MKKISLKTFRKSFNLSTKSKDEADFMVVQPPGLAAAAGAFGTKDEPSLFELAGCELPLAAAAEDDRLGKARPPKAEGLMGTLKRRLSAKQKQKAKGGPASSSSSSSGAPDDDAFSSASAPLAFKEPRAPRPIRSTSLRAHHYSPTPWPLRPTASEETCIKVEVRVKALVHAPGPGPALNGVRKDFRELQADPPGNPGPDPAGPRKGAPSPLPGPAAAELHLQLDAEQVPAVPAVLGLVPQDYIQYTVPLDGGLYPLDGASPMEVSAGPPPGRGTPDPPHPPHPGDPELVGAPPELFGEPPGPGLLRGPPGLVLQSPPAGRPQPPDAAPPPPLSPLLPPPRASSPPPLLQRHLAGLAGLAGPDAGRCPLDLDPAGPGHPGVARVYDSVPGGGALGGSSLTEELKKLARQGWYWGPITRWEAEGKLASVPDGSFLVRDSSDERYLLSLSFRSHGKTLHTRIEHSNGRFSFYEQPDVEGHTSIVDLIEHSIRDSENGAFCYSRSRLPGSATYPVRLTHPVSRFMQVRSLQYLCRFVIRQYTRIDLIQTLPLPTKMKDYLQEKHY
ncbi:suppressor of cytokine signaling 6 [Erinaceus europaeus]|uniref:Suppressor of cytokine signaling 6 n=1 Tax=Erinaceus europaeus TaxID=9365 RepID=A0ABM3W0B0_ERIEU|nr:suppressor of cytokine signaling 6 [Erinaceus europaeus]